MRQAVRGEAWGSHLLIWEGCEACQRVTADLRLSPHPHFAKSFKQAMAAHCKILSHSGTKRATGRRWGSESLRDPVHLPEPCNKVQAGGYRVSSGYTSEGFLVSCSSSRNKKEHFLPNLCSSSVSVATAPSYSGDPKTGWSIGSQREKACAHVWDAMQDYIVYLCSCGIPGRNVQLYTNFKGSLF